MRLLEEVVQKERAKVSTLVVETQNSWMIGLISLEVVEAQTGWVTTKWATTNGDRRTPYLSYMMSKIKMPFSGQV
jgi:hypothetical protein